MPCVKHGIIFFNFLKILAATAIVVTTAIITAAVTATVIACALIAEKQDDNKDYNP
jgi:hypothetical protein